MEYEKAWSSILGHNDQKACKFCVDGIGEAADIACGDVWFLKEGKTDFTEVDGRNVFFARNEIGNQVIKDAVQMDT